MSSQRPHVVAVVAQKGGTGKTITAANLAAAWARQGRAVLAVDADAQADLTADLATEVGGMTLADVLEAVSSDATVPREAICPCGVPGISVIPGGAALDEIAAGLYGAGAEGEGWLAAALTGELPVDVDLVVIDTPPNLGPLTIGALIAADIAVVVVSAQDTRSLTAVGAITDTMDVLGDRSHAELVGVLQRVDSRKHGRRRVSQWISEAFGGERGDDENAFGLEVIGRIPDTAAVQQAPAHGRPFVLEHPDSRAAVELEHTARRLHTKLTEATHV